MDQRFSSAVLFVLTVFLLNGQAIVSDDVRISQPLGFDELKESTSSRINHRLSIAGIHGSPKIFDHISSSEGRLFEPLPPKKVRKRRNVISGGRQVHISASQGCNGIILQWNAVSLPTSANLKYVNSEFKHFNVYRSNSFFSDVTGMTPHASGLTDPRLRLADTTRWVDIYPTPMVNWFYAVTIVDGKGREQTRVNSKKAIFVGAIEKEGNPFLIIPSGLRGRAMHHDVAFNPNRNEYLVAFDWDMNFDGISDHLYVARLNQAGGIVDKKVLNISATIPGWVSGEQGWPSVTFNRARNEYLVLFHFRSTKHFSNRHVILGQRIQAALTERASSPSVAATSDDANVREPKLLYNPKTGGYVASVILAKPKKDTVGLFFSPTVNVIKVAQVCSFPSDAYEHNLFHDSKRNEFYFTCTIENKAGTRADFELGSRPFMVLMTKVDSNGNHASNTPSASVKSLIGYSNKRHTRHEGYYNEKTDRLVIFWEELKDGKNTLSSTSLLMTRAIYIRERNEYTCPIDREVKSPVLLPMPISGGHYLLWQERSQFLWSIGGQLMKGGNFKLTNGVQKNPAVVYNVNRGMGFVVWQEHVGREIKLIGRHVTYSHSHTCSPGCTGNQRCVQQDTCNIERCAPNNGGCSHKCQSKSDSLLPVCTCPSGMDLDTDEKTCINNQPCRGMRPLKNPLTNQELFCGRGRLHVDCPKGAYCHVHPSDRFAKCCPDLLPEYTILVASQGVIWKAIINENRQKANFSRMPFTQGFMIVAIAYDPKEKRMYWSDVNGQTIKRAYMDGRGEEIILRVDVRVPDGMYLDKVDRKLYWTDTGMNRIEKSNLDGSDRQVLVNTGLDQPRAILLYKNQRKMYWSDWGRIPRIERSLIDGTKREVIITGGLGWPNGLTIDEGLRQLYWADAKVDKIETSDLEGRNRRVIVASDKAKHPFSIAILNNRKDDKMTKGSKKKPRYYVWWTDNEAGLTTDYDECLKLYSGKPNGRTQKFDSEEEAKEALENKLLQLTGTLDNSNNIQTTCTQNTTDQALTSSSPESPGITISQPLSSNPSSLKEPECSVPNSTPNNFKWEPGNNQDERLDNLIDFKNSQLIFNDKIEQAVTNVTIEVGELFTDLKNFECKSSNTFKEIKILIDNEIDKVKTTLQDFSSKFDKALEKLIKKNKNLRGELNNLKASTSQYYNSSSDTVFSSGPSRQDDPLKHYSVETSNRFQILSDGLDQQNSGTPLDNYNIQEVSSDDDNQKIPVSIPLDNDNTHQLDDNNIQYTAHSSSKVRPHELQDDALRNSTHIDKPAKVRKSNNILILSDSIYRGVIPNKLAPGSYVNKQYIRGGIKELQDHLTHMPNEKDLRYDNIILHTGTNDVGIIPTDEICERTANIIAISINKWPSSKITISGLTYRRDETSINRIIDEINEQSRITCNHFGNTSFLDNRKLTLCSDGNLDVEAFYDDKHLNNKKGTKLLVANLKRHLGLSINRVKSRRSYERRGMLPFNINQYNPIPYNVQSQQFPGSYQLRPNEFIVRDALNVLSNFFINCNY